MNRITAVSMRKGGAEMGGRGGSSHRTSAGRTSSAFDFLRRAYGENHANAVLAILQNAPEHIRSMWDDFSGQFRSTSLSRNARSAFYAPADNSVHLNISRVARGDVISTPYSVCVIVPTSPICLRALASAKPILLAADTDRATGPAETAASKYSLRSHPLKHRIPVPWRPSRNIFQRPIKSTKTC